MIINHAFSLIIVIVVVNPQRIRKEYNCGFKRQKFTKLHILFSKIGTIPATILINNICPCHSSHSNIYVWWISLALWIPNYWCFCCCPWYWSCPAVARSQLYCPAASWRPCPRWSSPSQRPRSRKCYETKLSEMPGWFVPTHHWQDRFYCR